LPTRRRGGVTPRPSLCTTLLCHRAYIGLVLNAVTIQAVSGVFSSAIVTTTWQKYSDPFYSCTRARGLDGPHRHRARNELELATDAS
jgi:hypothetical protein